MTDLDEQSFHGRPNVWLGEERTGSFHPEDGVQHPEPLLQQVRRVGLQVAHTLSCHYLRNATRSQVIFEWTFDV